MSDFLNDLPDFDDILFEKRNKEYGAYILRKGYNHVVLGSIIAAIIIGCAAVIIPYIRIPIHKKDVVYNVRYVSLENMRSPDEQVYIPEVPAPPAPPQSQAAIRYIAPVVVDSIMPFENSQILTAELMPATVLDQQGIVNGAGDQVGVLSDVDGGGNEVPFILVEVKPTFKGGDENVFRLWVQKRTIYPKIAEDNRIQGRVMITFIVETDGSVTNVKVLKSVDPILDNEALKAVMASPKWTPGRQRGEPVRVRFQIPIDFRL
jgi:periplasmic protein TonB